MATTQIAHGSRTGARPGQMMILFGLTLTIFIGALMLGVDLSRLRTEAENAQRVANAAALAGVVFLPDYTDDATYRAREEAIKNGFTDGKNGVSVGAAQVAGYPNRLKVTITEPVSLIFGGALGLGPQTISRSAVAEYALPLQMGSPDNVMGYAPYPTTLITSTGTLTTPTEGYYLEIRGNYGYQENGDAYSSYVESYAGPRFSGPITFTNPPGCQPIPSVCSPTLRANPDRAAKGFTGYDYIIDDPFTNTLVIKLFDPYDESSYYNDVHSLGSSLPFNQSMIAPYGSKYIDSQSPSTAFGNTTTTLRFQLSGPGHTATDPTMPLITTVPATATVLNESCYSGPKPVVNCVAADPFLAGNDPTYTKCHNNPIGYSSPSACYLANPSPYAYHFVNYAIIHGKGVYRLHVNATVNADGSYGTHGNMFGLAVCDAGSGTPPLASGNPVTDSTNGATADPYTPGGTTPGWNSGACASPNSTATCPNPGVAAPGQCVHIYGLGRMALFNNLSKGKSLIPLGYVPAEYAGKTLVVRLYDVGDSQAGQIEALTPAGDLSGTSPNGTFTYQHIDGNLNAGFPSSLNYTYWVKPTDCPNYPDPLPPSGSDCGGGSGYITIPVSATQQTTPGDGSLRLSVSASSGRFNGSWLTMQIPIPADNTSGTGYTDMVTKFGGYWKMMYDISANANDTTTWEISVAGSPVHLVTPSSS